MRIPHSALRETITVQDFNGSGAHGPVYAAARNVRASMQEVSRLVTDTDGRQVLINVVAFVRPESGPVPAESRVAWGTSTFRVIAATPMPDSRRPSHYELSLARYAG